jgi:hypothetical protein
MRRSDCLLVVLLLGGCAAIAPKHTPAPPQRNENVAEDRDAAAAVVVGNTFQNMQHLAQAPPAEQAEILSAARTSFERSPQGSVQLRYALLLAAPSHPGRDPVLAQTLLRQLAAQPETLVPIERAVTLIELAQVDRELSLKEDNDRLQSESQRGDRERTSTTATQRRLQAEMDENARLRKQVEDAQAKLDAIANIERNLTDRPSPGQGRQP